MTHTRRATELRRALFAFAGAGWGLAVAATLRRLWRRPAPPDQLPGFMTSAGLDAHGPMRELVATLLLIAIGALVAATVARLLERIRSDGAVRWTCVVTATSFLLSLMLAFRGSSTVLVVALPPVAIVLALVFRDVDARWSRRDVILLPALFSVWFALLELLADPNRTLALSIGLLLVVRLVVARERLLPAAAFTAVPVALLLQNQFLPLNATAAAVGALITSLLLPVAIAHWIGRREAAARVPARWFAVSFALTALLFPLTQSHVGATGRHRVNFFEDAHALLPASEILRGERPYIDIIPGHGLLTDGGIDAAAMRLGREDLASAYRGRLLVDALTPVAFYSVAAAATGSPEIGFLALLWAMAPFGELFWMRILFPFAALAAATAAVRRRSLRLLALAGVLVVPAFLMSLEFACYTALAVFIAALRWSAAWRGRLRACAYLASGFAVAAVAVGTALTLWGIASAFVRVTLREVLTNGPVYNLGFFEPDAALRQIAKFPEVLLGIFRGETLGYVLWGVVVCLTAALVAVSPLRMRRKFEPLILIGLWIALASISYAERKHPYFLFGVPLFLVVGATLLVRSRSPQARAGGAAAVALLVALAGVNSYLDRLVTLRRREIAQPAAEWQQWSGSSRAHGGWFRVRERVALDATRRFFESTLTPGETFFDFANGGLLYFLFDRDCPIRQYEVPYYEAEVRQREVISRLEANRNVRAVLLQFPHDLTSIDGTAPRERAPLVWKYIEQNFEPAFDEAGVVFWMRKRTQNAR